jgi:ribose/xylose/arabinose/galactoside ABC-type transport system permease subunit
LIFQIIRSGLQQVGADPYSYRLVEGVVIFIAMYADALKTGHADSGGGRLFRKG